MSHDIPSIRLGRHCGVTDFPGIASLSSGRDDSRARSCRRSRSHTRSDRVRDPLGVSCNAVNHRGRERVEEVAADEVEPWFIWHDATIVHRQDVLDFAYYSGWRRNEILELTWDEVDLKGGVIRLPARRSKTRTGRMLPISGPLRQVLDRRKRARCAGTPRVFRRDGVPVRVWRYALRDACRKAKVPHRLLHDCRRTAARNLIRAGVPERIAMLLTGHKTRAVFERYNIVNEQELLTAGERLAAYVAKINS